MQGIYPSLIILTRILDGKNILILFPKLKVQSYRIVWCAANAVVTFLIQIRIQYFFISKTPILSGDSISHI